MSGVGAFTTIERLRKFYKMNKALLDLESVLEELEGPSLTRIENNHHFAKKSFKH